MTVAKNYVGMLLTLFEEHDPDGLAHRLYRTIHDTGIEFKPGTLASSLGQPGWCYKNAFDYALGVLDEPEIECAYAEGWAVSVVGVPVAHAWCVTRTGEVIETTWPEIGVSYFGIPFEPNSLTRHIVKSKVWGVFNEHLLDNPLPLVHPWFQSCPTTPISN